jgi:hypothetical protein
MGDMIPAGDIADLQAALLANPKDLGVGLYRPSTGEIRLGSFDLVAQGRGHQGLADALGIKDNSEWRGFIVSSDGKFAPTSHFNLVDGSLAMKPDHHATVRLELKQAVLIS